MGGGFLKPEKGKILLFIALSALLIYLSSRIFLNTDFVVCLSLACPRYEDIVQSGRIAFFIALPFILAVSYLFSCIVFSLANKIRKKK